MTSDKGSKNQSDIASLKKRMDEIGTQAEAFANDID
jgi:hypothetical protein